MKNLNIKYCLLVLMIGLIYNFSVAQNNLSAGQVAQKATALVTDAKGLIANFSMQGNGRTGNGMIKSSGTKFYVELPDIKIWYNGTDLYTYNARTQETTIVKPTAQELLESNPLLYLKGGGGSYNYGFSPVKKNGKYVVELTPRNSKNEIKKMSFTVNSSNFKTERILVNTSTGTLTIEVKDMKTNESVPASDFEYPKNKYPKAEIVDLR